MYTGALGLMDILEGNKHDDPSSNPKRGCFHFTELLQGVLVVYWLNQWTTES